MKTTQARTKNRLTAKRPHRLDKARFDQMEITFAPTTRTPQSVIQWPSKQRLEEVSKRLLRINRLGIRWEASGDYFNSGDLAYQIHEIIRATDDLFKKTKRINRQP